ncbi:hypothetical protein BH09VER1_BH09VER1_29680 [soil metagenome]
MKNGQIFARKSTARGLLDLEYLDENSRRKVSLRQRADMDEQIGRKLKGFTDYASKESIGQVHAGGFLHDSVRLNPDGSSMAPSRLSNDERKRRITESWQSHLAKFPTKAKRPVIAHRLVFSMSIAQHDALVTAGINPDQVLHSTMKKIMRRFAEKFHPGDSIGFAYGLHHDTANLHAHVALCPRTSKGKYVGCSTSRLSRSRHKKQMDLIRSWFVQENARWEKILSTPQQTEKVIAKRLDSDRLVFSRRLNQQQQAALRSSQNGEALRLQQLYQAIATLERAINVQRAATTAGRNFCLLGKLTGRRRSKIEVVAERVAAAVQRRSIREQQTQLFKFKRQYRALHKRYTRLYGFSSYGHRHAEQQTATLRNSNL